ncbi:MULTISPECIES: hypothetical protein [Paenibacillus]|uniref:Uncharacterized protein n=1 Tax=Paenibacillus alvei TaxID=44250 RepID=A0ABT4E4V8_PAEAL|nr:MULTISPECIES: hypothetical protein [Paenibacillus]MCY9528140.1 hypothetical protein [Paenibacillus alvei]SDF48208.1 hypothetical protein SAMN04488689_105127 [Paenibacillus sp. cl6col]
MSPFLLIGVVAVIYSLLQITIPDIILSMKPFGVKTREAVRVGGFITLPIGILIIIADLVMN